MIWVLLFTLIFASSSSSLIIPKIDKYTKKCVVDKDRSKEILLLIKDDRKQRKVTLKAQRKNLKTLKALNESRTSTREEFDSLFVRILHERKILQEADAHLKMETEKIITEDEWQNILLSAEKDFQKAVDKRMKKVDKFEKEFNKLEGKIAGTISDDDRKEHVLKATAAFKDVLLNRLNEYKDYVTDKNSTVYKYRATLEEINEMHSMGLAMRKEVFDSFTDTHFILVENTTPEEWKKIMRGMKKLY